MFEIYPQVVYMNSVNVTRHLSQIDRSDTQKKNRKKEYIKKVVT